MLACCFTVMGTTAFSEINIICDSTLQLKTIHRQSQQTQLISKPFGVTPILNSFTAELEIIDARNSSLALKFVINNFSSIAAKLESQAREQNQSLDIIGSDLFRILSVHMESINLVEGMFGCKNTETPAVKTDAPKDKHVHRITGGLSSKVGKSLTNSVGISKPHIFSAETWKMFQLICILVFVIILIMCSRYGWGFAKGVIQHRRLCRISAVLSGGPNEFTGHITIAGLNGVRFQPIDLVTGKRIQDLLNEEGFVEFDIKIETKTLPVFVDGYHNFYAPLYFIEPLTREHLASILEQSMRKPTLVAHIGHKTTRRKWRAKIELRRVAIKSIRQSRNL